MKTTIFTLLFGTLSLIVITSCKHSANRTIKKDSISAQVAALSNIKKDTIIKKLYPPTDSGRLMMHLDSLPKATFPYKCEEAPWPKDSISLSAFKNKLLFNIPFKLIPTVIGGDFLDHGGDVNDDGVLPDSIRETFNMVDPLTYKTAGVLVATTPKFVAISLGDILVTLSYHADIIDAIRIFTANGNNHWHVERNTTIKKDLTIILHHWYSVQTDEQGNLDYENDYERWFIDANGYIKKFKGGRKK